MSFPFAGKKVTKVEERLLFSLNSFAQGKGLEISFDDLAQVRAQEKTHCKKKELYRFLCDLFFIDKRILRIIIQQITNLDRFQVIIRKNVWLAIINISIRHVGTGHCPAEPGCHIRMGSMNGQSVVKGAAPGFHLNGG